jgi:phospholipid transport system substrate-binding protein
MVLRVMSFLFALWLPLGLSAQEQSPEALVKNTSEEIISLIKEDEGLKSGDRNRLLELVDAKVLPHFDFERMTRLALGRHWRAASPEQRQTLAREFRDLLVRTYANAYLAYQKEHEVKPSVEVQPVRSAQGGNEVTVQTLVKQESEQPIRVDYGMIKTPQGWKVYDVVVGGVSLVTTYRSTFDNEAQQSGIDGLIALLKDRNRTGQTLEDKAKPEDKTK